MVNSEHDKAQSLSADAARYAQEGDLPLARKAFSNAAYHEETAFRKVGGEKPRTRGILGVSWVSLLYKSGDLNAAERACLELLATASLPPFAEQELRDLLSAIWSDQKLAESGRQFSERGLTLTLRGKTILAGTAPLRTVLDQYAGIGSLAYRSTEWLARFPFRTRGAPPQKVQELCDIRVTEPAYGSYRFTLEFTEPVQLELLPDNTVTASQITDLIVTLVDKVNSTAPIQNTQADLIELVPDEQYRNALLRLLRNLTPDGDAVDEVEFAARAGPNWRQAYLRPGAKDRITDALRRTRGSVTKDMSRETAIMGVLRALHLDENWVQVFVTDMGLVKCVTQHDVLDEVVGPMVNRQVEVRGYWGPKSAFHLWDISLSQGATSAPTTQ